MSGIPTRRAAAARRVAIIESDDEEDDDVAETTKKIEEDSGDDFTPEAPLPTRTPRKSIGSRKSTSSAMATPRPTPRNARPRKSVASMSSDPVEPSEIVDPDQSTATLAPPESSRKKALPRKRKSVAPKQPVIENTPEPDEPVQQPDNRIPLPTPRRSEEPSELHVPLADITSPSINGEKRSSPDPTVTQIKPIKALDTILEKPMDIVLKSRAMPMPVVEETGPKNRLVITYLILTNFKSYAGRQEVGPFHASFSSVVGPNGSGKSNVIDSLLFVFGFRASKMRQGKISALIHNSAAYPNLDHCEVAVHFQEVTDLVSLLHFYHTNGVPLTCP